MLRQMIRRTSVCFFISSLGTDCDVVLVCLHIWTRVCFSLHPSSHPLLLYQGHVMSALSEPANELDSLANSNAG